MKGEIIAKFTDWTRPSKLGGRWLALCFLTIVIAAAGMTLSGTDAWAASYVGDFVWEDMDGDGIQESGEPGIEKVSVELYKSDGSFVTSTTTDSNGKYSFSVSPNVNYYLKFVLPDGCVFSPQDQGCDNAIDSDPDPTTGLTDIFFVPNCCNDQKWDAGILCCDGSIGDLVWHDLNRNGIQDAGEPGITGVSVNLTGTDVDGNPVSMTDITDGSGKYLFLGLCEGTYEVEVDLATVPAGFNPTTPCSDDQMIGNDSNSDDTTNCSPLQTVDLPDSDTDNPTIDFGFVRPCDGSIGDLVWHDLNRNGIQDAGEPGITGVSVNLTGTDVDGNPVSMTDITDGSGKYLFLGLCEGTYEVEVDLATVPAGFNPTTPCSDDQTIVNDSNSDDMTNCSPSQTVNLPDSDTDNPTIDFGFVRPCDGSIGDLVWHDLNRNGIQDAGEPGITGVSVKLTGTDVDGNPVSMTDITDGSGKYLFLGLCEGTYVVNVDLSTVPTGFNPTTPCSDDQTIVNDSNSDDMTNCSPSQTVNLPDSDTDNPTIDFGFVRPCDGSIGDLVWHDLNRNGIQDAGEPGITGVSVKLTGTDVDGNPVSMTDITDGSGKYLFLGLCEGTYVVNVDLSTVPTGFNPTTPCSDDQTIVNDSNSDDMTNCSPSQTVNLPDSDTDNPTIDFGFVRPCDGSIGDLVWHDLNRNGIQDAGEPGIPNVSVKLTGTDVDGNSVSMTDITDGSGKYLFLGLCEGTYEVEVNLATVPTGFNPTTPCSSDQTIGNDSNSDDMTNCTPSQTVNLPDSDTDNPTIDFGFVRPCDGSIGDLVWHDLNRNGIQDAGEPGIPNVSVKLTGTDVDGNSVSMTDITDGSGKYLFLGLCEGTYEVEVNLATVPTGFNPTTPCSSDQTIGNDSNSDDMTNCTPLQTVNLPDSEGNTDNTTIDFGFITPACTLMVTKTCFVPSPPSGVFECDKPINVLTMIWDGTEAIRIKAWKGAADSTTLLADVDNIMVGDEVTVSGFAGSPNDVIWEVFEAGTSVKIGESTFHLSCSDNDMNGTEDCGKRQGDGKDKSGFINDWLLEGMVDAKNSFDCTVDQISQGADECEFFTQEATLCEKRPTAISLRYTGGDCSQTSHNQDPGKVSCTDFFSLVEPVRIVMSKTDGSNVSLDTGGAVVQFGDIVTATAANAGRSEFDSESLVQVFDENNILLQEIVFHTSCSQPLAPGDQFGSVEVVGFENADQGQVQLGVEVEYTYEIKNIGEVEVFNLTVEDSVLGTVPGSPIASLGSDETITLTATAFVEKTTTNTVTVTGETIFGDECSAMDWSTVTAVGPPPCTVSSVEFKISDDKIEWKLSNDGDNVVTIDSIEVSWPDTLGDLKKVKREKDTIFEGPVPPPSATITSDMMTSDIKKRQIKPGESKKVKFEFAAKASTVPGDYEITVNFAERCSVTFEPADIPFVCSDAKPIDSLTMIWGGSNDIVSIDVYRDKYDPNDPTKNLMYTIDGPIVTDDEVTAEGYAAADAKNDVDWVITFSDGNEGVSRFHRSCSDNDMNGPEDCGKAEGNSKDNTPGFINQWLFEGMAGNGLTLDCTP